MHQQSQQRVKRLGQVAAVLERHGYKFAPVAPDQTCFLAHKESTTTYVWVDISKPTPTFRPHIKFRSVQSLVDKEIHDGEYAFSAAIDAILAASERRLLAAAAIMRDPYSLIGAKQNPLHFFAFTTHENWAQQLSDERNSEDAAVANALINDKTFNPDTDPIYVIGIVGQIESISVWNGKRLGQP